MVQGHKIDETVINCIITFTAAEREIFYTVSRESLDVQANRAQQNVLIFDKQYKNIVKNICIPKDILTRLIRDELWPARFLGGQPLITDVIVHMENQLYFIRTNTLTSDQIQYLRSEYITSNQLADIRNNHRYIMVTLNHRIAFICDIASGYPGIGIFKK